MADIASIPVSSVARGVFGNKRYVIADLTIGDGSSTFPVAGVSLTPAELGLTKVDSMLIAHGSIEYSYDATNELMMGYVPAETTGADKVSVAADDAVPDEIVRCLVLGVGG